LYCPYSQGLTVSEASRKLGITEQTYYRWRRENGGMRVELLNREIFTTLIEAKVLIADWRKEYNQVRPHSSLDIVNCPCMSIRNYSKLHLCPPIGLF
jgi:transposase-like protein